VCGDGQRQVGYEVQRSYSGEVGRLVVLTPAKFSVHAVAVHAAIPREPVAAERKALMNWPHAAAKRRGRAREIDASWDPQISRGGREAGVRGRSRHTGPTRR
jgi:hypothetical protein